MSRMSIEVDEVDGVDGVDEVDGWAVGVAFTAVNVPGQIAESRGCVSARMTQSHLTKALRS